MLEGGREGEREEGGALDDLSEPPGAVAENFGAAAPIRKQISDLWSQDRGLQNVRSGLGGAARARRGGATMYRRGAKKGAKKRTRALRAVANLNQMSASTSSGGFRALEGTALGGARQILNLPWDRGAS